MPGAETVKLQVELIEKNAEARLKALDKLAKEMGNRKITLNFDEASLARWKAATDNMTSAQLSAYAKMVTAAENANAKIIAAGQKSVQEEMKSNTKLVTERQKSIDKKIALYEKEDTKRRQAAEKTAQTEINAQAKVQVATLKGVQGTRQHTQAQKELNTEAQKTDSIFSGLTSRFTAANLLSSLITSAISALRSALREAVSEMKEMDKELTTIKMVSGASDSEIASLREAAFQRNGRSTSDYLSAAERFTRAGYRDNIKELTDLSLVTQNVGGVTEDVASKFILAADAAWKLGGNAEALTAILDGMTAVSDQNATDIGKLAEGMTVAGSSFANAGESAETYTALMGTVTAATQRSGSEVSRGLQTILFRVRQVKGELDDGEMISADDISNAAKALDSVGISVLNDSKELKSFSGIMGELARKWDTLNTKQQAYLQNALAGNRRGNILFALMDNWDVFEKQLQQYEDGAGSAAEKNAIFTESWEAATNDLNKAWTETVSLLTDSGGMLKGIVDLATEALDLINQIQKWSHEGRPKGYFERAEEWRTTTGRNILTPRMDGFSGGGGGRSFADDAWEATDAQNALVDATIQVIKVYDDEAEAVDQLSEAFSKAEKNIKAASEAMKTDKDDAVKSAADIFKAMNEAADKGYYGSNKYTAGANLFYGETDPRKIKQEARDAITAYFDGIKEGDYSNAAAELWGKFANESGEIVDYASGTVIASMRDIGDSYEWAFNKGNQSIDEFLQSMQQSTGIGADFWASMIQSLGMYSDEMDQWMEENKEIPEPELKIQTDSAKEEVKAAVDEINKMLAGIQDKTVRINVIQSIDGLDVSSAYGKVKAATHQNEPTAHYWSGGKQLDTSWKIEAGGKRDSYSGIALVNDQFPADGSTPELIISKSRGGAFIANGGRPALVNLRSDDIVLTARETKSALGFPGFPVGKNNMPIDLSGEKFFVGTEGEKTSPKAVTVTSPKTTAKTPTTPDEQTESNPDATESWSTLKKLVDYLLEKGEDDLKDQLKVLDDQLAELEAERKAQEESNKLQERQEAVQQALLDLNKAQVERTVRYYNEETQQWEWMADQKAVQDAQEAYEKALKDLNDYLADQDYEERRAAIEAQKDDLQAQFDAYKESWDAIVDAIEAPSGDIEALLAELKSNGTSTMIDQSGGIAALLNALRTGLVASGYQFGLSNINANTSGSTTGADTVFDSGGIALGSGYMRKGDVGAEMVIGPDITRDILNPVRNARFTDFTDSLRYLLGSSDLGAVSSRGSFVTNNSGGNYYINGVQVGQDMMQRPFAEVMRNISLHVNEAM